MANGLEIGKVKANAAVQMRDHQAFVYTSLLELLLLRSWITTMLSNGQTPLISSNCSATFDMIDNTVLPVLLKPSLSSFSVSLAGPPISVVSYSIPGLVLSLCFFRR